MPGGPRPSRVSAPDRYPPQPTPADVVRVDPEVVKPWRRMAFGLLALLCLILGGVLWAAAEVRALRTSDALEALRKQHEEVQRANEQRRDGR